MQSPLISVVIPAYNQAKYLPAALDSVIQQTYKNLEIILIDDGSTDTTRKIGEQFACKDSRVKVFAQENHGPSSARNHGISISHGNYICLLDADDVMLPQRVLSQLEVFQTNPPTDIVYTALTHIDSKGHPCGEMRSLDYPPENFLAQLFFRNVIPGPSTIMTKRECLTAQTYNETFKHAEDYELMLRLAHIYRFKYLDEPLTNYRRHSDNLSNDLRSHRLAEMKVLQTYAPSHVAHVVALTSYSDEQKALLEGKILFNMDYIKASLEIFHAISSPVASFYAGNCYLYLNENDSALKAYNTCLDKDANPACHNNKGVVLARLGQSTKAIENFEMALKLKSDYLDPQYNLKHIDHSTDLRVTWRELRQDLVPYKTR